MPTECDSVFDQTDFLRVRGLRVWSQTIERVADLDLDLLRLTFEGARLRYREVKDGNDPTTTVEAWAVKTALAECIDRRQECRASVYRVNMRAFLSQLDSVVLALISHNSFIPLPREEDPFVL